MAARSIADAEENRYLKLLSAIPGVKKG